MGFSLAERVGFADRYGLICFLTFIYFHFCPSNPPSGIDTYV